jgi:hypothetical protein
MYIIKSVEDIGNGNDEEEEDDDDDDDDDDQHVRLLRMSNR